MKGTDHRAGKGTIDRRTLLQLIGTAGATMTATTACGTVFGKAPAEGLPAGAEFEKSITLATAGPGGNKAWRPGDYLQFLPAERIPTSGKASTLLASQTKAKLLEL